MEEPKLKQIYKIEKKRLLTYFERIRNQHKNHTHIQIITKFLHNQSIGTTEKEVLGVLRYYKDKLSEGKDILDFAFEWIRAQKIRIEYKRFLFQAQYPNNSVAMDDCIFLFFLKYDNYVRKLFKLDVKEYEISALYEVFFSSHGIYELNMNDVIEKHMGWVPTVYEGNDKINTNIFTLRSGINEFIVEDYNRSAVAPLKEKKIAPQVIPKQVAAPKIIEIFEFNGSHLTREIKSFCFKKIKIDDKKLEIGISQFLSSYFRQGKFYKYDQFKDLLIKTLTESIFTGLTGMVKERNPLEFINGIISNALSDFRKINKIKVMDGLAWINDLRPTLIIIVSKFVENLFEPKEIRAYRETDTGMNLDSQYQEIDFSDLFDLNLEIEEFREKLEEKLRPAKLGLIEKRNLVRNKVQEFTALKRKNLRKKIFES